MLFICGPHANQFLDPLLLFSEVRKEAHRRVAVLTAAKVSGRGAGVCPITPGSYVHLADNPPEHG